MFEDERKGQLDEEALEQARKDGKRIGLVMGSWDQCHIGHIRYLKRAKEECDYLIVGVDSDEKIRKRKGPNRPLIPEGERYDTIKELGVNETKKYEPGKNIADDIVFKPAKEEKWELIKKVKPDVLVAIPENYSMEDVDKLTNECGVGRVAIFGRQAETSSSNKLRQILIANMADKVEDYENKLNEAIENTKANYLIDENSQEPLPQMMEHLHDSSDWKTPVVAATRVNGKWYFGTNRCDYTLSKEDLNNRTELFYSTVTHAEIDLLKRISSIVKDEKPDTIYSTLFPCDKCMKTLIDKGIKTIYYLEDHPEKGWSQRSHELANKKGITTICLTEYLKNKPEEKVNPNANLDFSNLQYTYPPNVREQEQLDIMLQREIDNQDPMDIDLMAENQEIIAKKKYWYITENKFPYKGAERQFLLCSLEPIYNFDDISEEMWIELQELIKELKDEYNMDGGALCFRYGNPALSGASLKRPHAHLIKPLLNEKVKFTVGGNTEVKDNIEISEEKRKALNLYKK